MPTPINDEDLAEIRARISAATPGPWQAVVEGRDQSGGESFILIGQQGAGQVDLYLVGDRGEVSAADLDLIAHARQDLPALVDVLANGRALAPFEAELAQMEDRIRRATLLPRWSLSRSIDPLDFDSTNLIGPTGSKILLRIMSPDGPPGPASLADAQFVAHSWADLTLLVNEARRLWPPTEAVSND